MEKLYMSRLLLMLCLLTALCPQAFARFTAMHNNTVLPQLKHQPYKTYLTQQTAYLNHLKTCSPLTLQMISPNDPSLQMVKTIVGPQGRFCHVEMLTRANNKPQATPKLILCNFTRTDLHILTRPAEYDYLNNIMKNNTNKSADAYMSKAEKVVTHVRCVKGN